MKTFPNIKTKRLLLRQFNSDDALYVQDLAGHIDIASTTLRIPYPYKDGMAAEWIKTLAKKYTDDIEITLAVTFASDKTLVGAISLMLNRKHDRAEMGYWIGKPYWNKGFGGEAAKAMLKYGFEKLGLHRINAHHFKRNQASGRILQKIGMSYEGCLRHHIKKWDKYEDIECYGILDEEYFKKKSSSKNRD